MAGIAVKMTMEWSVPLGQSRSITDALQQLMIGARASRGCVGCNLSTDFGAQADVRYTEEWADEAMLRQQLRSDRFAKLASLLESSSRPPVVEFALSDGIRGLDYAEEARADLAD